MLRHVLEHIADPLAFLAEIADANQGGQVDKTHRVLRKQFIFPAVEKKPNRSRNCNGQTDCR